MIYIITEDFGPCDITNKEEIEIGDIIGSDSLYITDFSKHNGINDLKTYLIGETLYEEG